MKRVYFIMISASLFFVGCGQKGENEMSEDDMIKADKAALAQAIVDRDSLFSIINEISNDMSQIKELEQILVVTNSMDAESVSKREGLKNDIEAIKLTLHQRREKLEKLETKLKKSQFTNSKLKKTIETLKAQIDSQKVEIENLSNELLIAKDKIVVLEKDKDSLNQTITNVAAAKAEVEQIALEAINNVNELNKCYYIIGSSKELKDMNILKSRFMKKATINHEDFNNNLFITADKRTLTSIPIHSNEVKILTNHPLNTYSIVDENGQKVINITNPSQFWSHSNYLIIEID